MATEKRLIDANAFQLDPDPNGVMNGVLIVGGERERIMTMAQLALKRMIDNAPTVDAVEVVHGRWTYTEGEYEVYMICSECGSESDFRTNYCPNCGAKMDGDGNG